MPAITDAVKEQEVYVLKELGMDVAYVTTDKDLALKWMDSEQFRTAHRYEVSSAEDEKIQAALAQQPEVKE